MPKKLLKVHDGHLTLAEIPAANGIIISVDDSFDNLVDLNSNYDWIGIQFDRFTDGRGFSLACQIRAELGFRGELIACGDIFDDQISMLLRCGFNSVEVSDEFDVSERDDLITPFSDYYQACTTQPQPLFTRTARG